MGDSGEGSIVRARTSMKLLCEGPVNVYLLCSVVSKQTRRLGRLLPEERVEELCGSQIGYPDGRQRAASDSRGGGTNVPVERKSESNPRFERRPIRRESRKRCKFEFRSAGS